MPDAILESQYWNLTPIFFFSSFVTPTHRICKAAERYQRLGGRRDVWNTRSTSTTSPRTR